MSGMDATLTVARLERALFEMFPRADAEPWDHVGLSVGDPGAPVRSVAVALDADPASVRLAAEAGADVLLTHHPVYIKAPDAFAPAAPERPSASAVVFEAARRQVSILSFHTNLDRSLEARRALPGLVGLAAATSIEHPGEPGLPGLGALCPADGLTVGALAGRCARAFGTEPRVWGDADRPVGDVAFLGGSLGDLGEAALAAGAGAIVCGEAGYHVCQDLCARGCAVILLGHDRSEEPFTEILMDAARRAGVDPDAVRRIDRPRLWWTAQGDTEPEGLDRR